MLSRLLKRIRYFLALRRLTTSQRMAQDWLGDAREVVKQLDAAAKHLERETTILDEQERFIRKILDKQSAALDKSNQLIRQQETVVEALRSENKVLGIEVETLAASHRVVLERCNAMSAQEVVKQVISNGKEER